MKMEPLPRNMSPETNTRPPPPHFPRLYAEHYIPISLPPFIPIQGFQENLGPGIPVFPIRSIPPKDDSAESNAPGRHNSAAKTANQVASVVLKPKQSKKKPSACKKPKGPVIQEITRERNNPDIIDLNGPKFDFSKVPSPVCSCTGIARVCYKWGAGGWQSSCCTIGISEYPLPMSHTRPGSRMAGRKMSSGAYMKLLLRLANEGNDLSRPVDLSEHWCRHGTNKFVTIR